MLGRHADILSARLNGFEWFTFEYLVPGNSALSIALVLAFALFSTFPLPFLCLGPCFGPCCSFVLLLLRPHETVSNNQITTIIADEQPKVLLDQRCLLFIQLLRQAAVPLLLGLGLLICWTSFEHQSKMPALVSYFERDTKYQIPVKRRNQPTIVMKASMHPVQTVQSLGPSKRMRC